MIKTHCTICSKPVTVKTEQYTGNEICNFCETVLNSRFDDPDFVIIAGNEVMPAI